MAEQGGPGGRGFEELLNEAERLAEELEEGGLPLDGSIRAYEKGIENLRHCAALLKEAEGRVKALLEKNGEFRLEDLEAEDGEVDGDGEDGA